MKPIIDIAPSVLLYGSPEDIEAAFAPETEHDKALNEASEAHYNEMRRNTEIEDYLDRASVAFEEFHEFPSMATDRDREDWIESWLDRQPRYVVLMEGGDA